MTRSRIEIRNINRAPFEADALARVVGHYARSNRRIIVRFDNRLTCLGQHEYVTETRTHTISVCVKRCRNIAVGWVYDFPGRAVTATIEALKNDAARLAILATLLHEIEHLRQCERDRRLYFSKAYHAHPDVSCAHMAYVYSPAEVAARHAEAKAPQALALYNKHRESQ